MSENDNPSYRYTQMQLDFAYFAGLFDGEGSISFAHRKTRHFLEPKISITNTDKAIMEEVHLNFGGHLYSYPDKRNPNWKQRYEWYVHNMNDIEIFLSKILPYLKIKHKQAELMIEFISLRKGLKGKKRFSKKHASREFEIKGEMLNENRKRN